MLLLVLPTELPLDFGNANGFANDGKGNFPFIHEDILSDIGGYGQVETAGWAVCFIVVEFDGGFSLYVPSHAERDRGQWILDSG